MTFVPGSGRTPPHWGPGEDPETADPEQDDLNIMTERACVKCGDLVLILSSRDWCDGCEMEDPE